MGGQVHGWEIADLAAGASQTFQITGTLSPDGFPNQNDCSDALRQNNVEAFWGCGTGCENPTPVSSPSATLKMPDLTITKIEPSGCEGDGEFSGTIDVTIKNQGDGDTLTPFTIEVADGTVPAIPAQQQQPFWPQVRHGLFPWISPPGILFAVRITT